MKTLTNSTLRTIDRAISKLGPLSFLLDKIVERVAPVATASACAGSFCKTTCTNVRCGHFLVGYSYYSTAPRGCEQGIYTCSVRFCTC